MSLNKFERGFERKLLPCPHCGSKAHIGEAGAGYFFAQCNKCPATTKSIYTIAATLEAWNRRVER